MKIEPIENEDQLTRMKWHRDKFRTISALPDGALGAPIDPVMCQAMRDSAKSVADEMDAAISAYEGGNNGT